jgi:hypothetical protein
MIETLSKFYDNKPLLGAVIVLLLALSFLLIGILLQPSYKKMAAYPETEAEVTRVYENKDDDDSRVIESYTVHTAFTMGGKRHSRAFTCSSRPGNTVPVRHNPEDPGDFHMASNPPKNSEMFYAAGVFAFIAALLFFAASDEVKKKRQAPVVPQNAA